MRKYALMIVVLVVIAACGMAWAMEDSVKKADNIIYEKTKYVGELSAADGLKIQFENRTGSNWLDYEVHFKEGNVDCYINNIGSSYDPYSLEAANDSEDSLKIYAANTNASDVIDPYSFTEVGMADKQEKIKNLYEMILEREEKHMEPVVYGNLSDYCEYYPVSLMVSIPGKFSTEGNGRFINSSFLAQDENETGVLAYEVEKLNQFFRIPVEEQKVDITYSKLDDGKYLVEENNSPGVNSFNLGITTSGGTATDDAIFFFINNRREDGSLVDTSLIPGGYGIYRLPYRKTSQKNSGDRLNKMGFTIDVDELETYFPLEEQSIIRKIGVSPDQSKLYVLAEEEGRLVLKMISLETGSMLSSTGLGNIQTSDRFIVNEVDGHIVIQKGMEKYIVLDEKDGTYSVELDIDLTSIDLHSRFSLDMVLARQLAIACNGETIAIIGSDNFNDSIKRSSGFTLMILNNNGVQYFGEFTNGFEESNDYFEKRGQYGSLSWLDTENKLKVMFE